VLLVTVSTVDRFTRRWHKRYLRISAAFGAFDVRHLPRGAITSIVITHFVFHRPNFLVIRKIILAAVIGMTLTVVPSSTQVRSPVYHLPNTQDHHKNQFRPHTLRKFKMEGPKEGKTCLISWFSDGGYGSSRKPQ